MKREQAIFDAVAVHLLLQGQSSTRASTQHMGCAYRGQDGAKCAIGILIPDEKYDARLEGQSVSDLVDSGQFTKICGFSPSQGELILLTRLQNIHDEYNPHEWPMKLRESAREFGLASSTVNDFAVEDE